MMVGLEGYDTDYHDDEKLDAEEELYNLMRGSTSLMIAAASDDSDEESDESGEEDDDGKSDSSEESSQLASSSTAVEPAGRAPFLTSSSASPEWGSLATKAPTWGNKEEETDPEWADEWREGGRTQDRRTRDEEIARGASPPPKLEEDNIFTDGSSRKRTMPAYRPKY